MFDDEYEFAPGDKVFLNFKNWEREIKASLNGVELNDGDLLEIVSVGGVFALIREFNQTIPKQYLKLACEVCQKEPAFRKGGYTKCLSCARNERDRIREELVATLTVEQLEIFSAYEFAADELSSMCMLD